MLGMADSPTQSHLVALPSYCVWFKSTRLRSVAKLFVWLSQTGAGMQLSRRKESDGCQQRALVGGCRCWPQSIDGFPSSFLQRRTERVASSETEGALLAVSVLRAARVRLGAEVGSIAERLGSGREDGSSERGQGVEGLEHRCRAVSNECRVQGSVVVRGRKVGVVINVKRESKSKYQE